MLHPWAIHGGVNAAHYRPYEAAKSLCASNTIYMPTEFEHGLYDGGAGAGLEDYWKIMSASKICAGVSALAGSFPAEASGLPLILKTVSSLVP